MSQDLDIHSPDFVADPYAVYERLRRECPVARGEKYGGYWLLTRYEDVRQAARDWRTFTSSVPGVTSIPAASRRTEPQLPLEVDPPLHSRYRALVNPVFAPARIERLRPRVESIAAGLVDGVLERLRAGKVVDLVADYCVPLSVLTLAEFTGLPREDGPQWVEWERVMFDIHDPQGGARATREMSAYILALVGDRKRALAAGYGRTAETVDDFITLLLTSEVDGHRLTDREIHAFCQLQFGAGFETTADAMSVTLHYLTQQPAARQQLAGDQSLHAPAVEEFLRYVTPIQIFGRNASHDLELHGRAIKQGDVVALSFASANHDPSVFPDPEMCVLDRFASTGPAAATATGARHLTFGAGVHLCLGAPVARLELAITLREFTTRVPPLSLARDPAPTWKHRGDRRGLATLPVVLAE